MFNEEKDKKMKFLDVIESQMKEKEKIWGADAIDAIMMILAERNEYAQYRIVITDSSFYVNGSGENRKAEKSQEPNLYFDAIWANEETSKEIRKIYDAGSFDMYQNHYYIGINTKDDSNHTFKLEYKNRVLMIRLTYLQEGPHEEKIGIVRDLFEKIGEKCRSIITSKGAILGFSYHRIETDAAKKE